LDPAGAEQLLDAVAMGDHGATAALGQLLGVLGWRRRWAR